MNRLQVRVVTLGLTLAVVAIAAYAAITGVISGTVTDPSGAVVPKATVVATNQLTGVKQAIVTDARGFYSFPALDVGIYTISATVPGFQIFSVTDIRVDANSSIRTDIALKIGTQTVTEVITANPVQIETQSTQVGQLIEGQQILAVPLDTRAFTDLLSLQPSVSPYIGTSEGGKTGTVSGDLNGGNMSINGSREASNAFMVNGADVNDGVENTTAIIPNLDSLSEFRIITSNYDAEYGNFNGGQVNVVTKSGTSKFHGSLFEFLRNTDFNAANYFNNGVRSPYDQSIFGGTIGGPIKKDKLFFFGDFQGTKYSQGTTEEPNVPSTADLAGNIADQASLITSYAGTVGGAGWANVLTNRLGYTVSNNEPYYQTGCNSTSWTTGSTTGCVFPTEVIPQTAWDPVVSNVLKYIPSQNNLMGGVFTSDGGYPAVLFTSFPAHLADYKESERIDYTSHIGSIFAYYFLDNDSLVNPFAGGSTPQFPAETTGRAQLAVLGLTTTFKGDSVNSYRMSYMRSATHTGRPTYSTPGPSLSSLGFQSPWSNTTGGIGNIDAPLAGVPSITIGYGANTVEFGTPGESQGHYDNTFQWIDNFTKVVGTHTLQAGINYHFDEVDERNYIDVNGGFTFSDDQETGSGWADFLLGAEADSFTQASQQLLDSRSYYLGAYGEDSWRATHALTLNYGIRYEISTPWWDATNKLETFIAGEESQVFPGAPVGWVMPGDPGVPRTLAPVKHNKFAPRVGFAWAPQTSGGFMEKLAGGDKFSVRGSYGIFYTNFQDESGFVEVGDPPYGLYWETPWPTELSAPFVNRATQQITPAKFPYAWPPTNVSRSNPDPNIPWSILEPLSSDDAVNPANTIPYTQEFSLSIQRQFGGETVLTLNYVGSQGRHLANSVELDPGNIALCQSLSQASEVAPGTPTCGPKGESQQYTAANGTIYYGTRIQDATNGEGLAFGSNPWLDTDATSNYNAFQANLRHTSKYGEVLLGYTYAKSMDDASSLTGDTYIYDPHADYSLSEFDVPQYLVASFNFHPPLPSWVSNGFAKAVVGGWAFSGIAKFAAGTPVTISETDDHSLTGNIAEDLPNYSPTESIVGDHNPRDRKAWFNTSLFSKEPVGGPYGDSLHRFFVGPGLDHTDLSLQRNFRVHEAAVFNFRAEAFNIANHAEFSNPGGSINSSSFGKITAAPQNQRVLELVGKFSF